MSNVVFERDKSTGKVYVRNKSTGERVEWKGKETADIVAKWNSSSSKKKKRHHRSSSSSSSVSTSKSTSTEKKIVKEGNKVKVIGPSGVEAVYTEDYAKKLGTTAEELAKAHIHSSSGSPKEMLERYRKSPEYSIEYKTEQAAKQVDLSKAKVVRENITIGKNLTAKEVVSGGRHFLVANGHYVEIPALTSGGYNWSAEALKDLIEQKRDSADLREYATFTYQKTGRLPLVYKEKKVKITSPEKANVPELDQVKNGIDVRLLSDKNLIPYPLAETAFKATSSAINAIPKEPIKIGIYEPVMDTTAEELYFLSLPIEKQEEIIRQKWLEEHPEFLPSIRVDKRNKVQRFFDKIKSEVWYPFKTGFSLQGKEETSDFNYVKQGTGAQAISYTTGTAIKIALLSGKLPEAMGAKATQLIMSSSTASRILSSPVVQGTLKVVEAVSKPLYYTYIGTESVGTVKDFLEGNIENAKKRLSSLAGVIAFDYFFRKGAEKAAKEIISARKAFRLSKDVNKKPIYLVEKLQRGDYSWQTGKITDIYMKQHPLETDLPEALYVQDIIQKRYVIKQILTTKKPKLPKKIIFKVSVEGEVKYPFLIKTGEKELGKVTRSLKDVMKEISKLKKVKTESGYIAYKNIEGFHFVINPTEKTSLIEKARYNIVNIPEEIITETEKLSLGNIFKIKGKKGGFSYSPNLLLKLPTGEKISTAKDVILSYRIINPQIFMPKIAPIPEVIPEVEQNVEVDEEKAMAAPTAEYVRTNFVVHEEEKSSFKIPQEDITKKYKFVPIDFKKKPEISIKEAIKSPEVIKLPIPKHEIDRIHHTNFESYRERIPQHHQERIRERIPKIERIRIPIRDLTREREREKIVLQTRKKDHEKTREFIKIEFPDWIKFWKTSKKSIGIYEGDFGRGLGRARPIRKVRIPGVLRPFADLLSLSKMDYKLDVFRKGMAKVKVARHPTMAQKKIWAKYWFSLSPKLPTYREILRMTSKKKKSKKSKQNLYFKKSNKILRVI